MYISCFASVYAFMLLLSLLHPLSCPLHPFHICTPPPSPTILCFLAPLLPPPTSLLSSPLTPPPPPFPPPPPNIWTEEVIKKSIFFKHIPNKCWLSKEGMRTNALKEDLQWGSNHQCQVLLCWKTLKCLLMYYIELIFIVIAYKI